MRIVKSNKAVKASAKITKQLKKQIFEDLEALGGYFNYDRAVDDVMSEYSLSKEDAESIVWDFTIQSDVEGCSDVKASKNMSADEKAISYIKAAIDTLGKSGDKSEVTKDSIANLSVVLYDLKSK